MVEEVRAHSKEISKRAGVATPLLEETLDQLLQNIDLAPLSSYESKLDEALKYVRDESDAPFTALALVRSPSTIVTYNKRLSIPDDLRGKVQVQTPIEALRELH